MAIPKIAVVGSYATGLTMTVQRLPGTGETVLGSGYRVDFGGKGSNQAVACARLGARVSFIATIGKDGFGEDALGLYRDEGIDISNIRQTAKAPTGVGFIVVETVNGSNCIVLDPGANELLTAEDVRESAPCISGAAVLLTQLEIPVATAEAALVQGRLGGAVSILNPAPVRRLPASLLQAVDILTPNESEAKVLTGRDAEADVDPQDVARDLVRQGVKEVVMTLGGKGALIVSSSSTRHVPAHPVRAVDTTGAGDAFNAGLAMALASGASLEDSVGFAVITGALAVTREGVVPALPRRGEVREFCRSRGLAVPPWLPTGGA